jgi:hypothetical protein
VKENINSLIIETAIKHPEHPVTVTSETHCGSRICMARQIVALGASGCFRLGAPAVDHAVATSIPRRSPGKAPGWRDHRIML